MINPKLIIMFLACMAIVMWACRPAPTPADTVLQISEAVEGDNLDEAHHLIRQLMGDAASMDGLGVEHLCLLSVTAARMADSSADSEEYTGFALRCYQEAISRDSLRTDAYIATLPSSSFRYLSMVIQLKRSIDQRRMGLSYLENEDSLCNE